jgi:sensor domain CHASE-containing protein
MKRVVPLEAQRRQRIDKTASQSYRAIVPVDGTIACTQAANQLRKHLDLVYHLTSKLTAKPRENHEQWETSVDKMA